jgi:sugar lactone lactonase YvrE
VRTLLSGGVLFEAPRWHNDGWWVSDVAGDRVLAFSESGDITSELEVQGGPAGLDWLPDDSLLVVASHDRTVLRRSSDGVFSVYADLGPFCAGPANEVVVDEHGRAFVGELGFDILGGGSAAPANLLRVDPGGVVTVVAEGLQFPNASAITANGRTLLLAETFGSRITAFTILLDGSLADRRTWGAMGEAVDPNSGDWGLLFDRQLAPDGLTLDAAGHIWVCDPANARCVRLAPGGGVVAEIAMPDGLTAFGCMLGGADRRTLLITAAPYEPFGSHDSVLLTTLVDVPGVGRP